MIITALIIAALWQVFDKAGRPGWYCLIPFYNVYKEFEIAWETRKFWRTVLALSCCYVCLILVGIFEVMDDWVLMLLFLIVGIGFLVWYIVLIIKFHIRMARAFGQSDGFGIGLAFLGPIFLAILGFGDAVYYGPQYD